jgi:hypothetical protein
MLTTAAPKRLHNALEPIGGHSRILVVGSKLLLKPRCWMVDMIPQVQRAIFIVESAPVYPDMLAMLNSMALLASQNADSAPEKNVKEPEQTANTST